MKVKTILAIILTVAMKNVIAQPSSKVICTEYDDYKRAYRKYKK